MNKELSNNGLTVEQELDRHKRWLKERNETIKKLTTPPTAEQVCKALTKHLKYKTHYSKKGKSFRLGHPDISYVCELMENGYIRFNKHLPSHLITLLGQFYEEELRKSE